MHRMFFRLVVLMGALAVAVQAGAGSREGRYVSDEAEIELTIKEAPGGTITAVLTGGDGGPVQFTAREKEGRYAGTIDFEGKLLLPVSLQWNGKMVMVEIGPPGDVETVAFVLAGGAKAVTAKAGEPTEGVPLARKVSINGMKFTNEELMHAESVYGIRIPDADYWYDNVLGAWGVRGGPTAGFIAHGLQLGGELQADASGGGTDVFVNGRELHPHDLIALQQLTGSILPGRYFIVPQGYAGIEGGPPLWDLGALVARASGGSGGGGGGGGSNTWQSRITGASGFSDGTTSAVFLPNGGIVSTGN